MRQIIGSLVAICVTTASVAADVIPVRSAEHDGFTRVVVDLSPDTEWFLTADDGTVQFATQPTTKFDLSDIYRRISRKRVAAISADGSGNLSIDLGCICTVEQMRHPKGWAIIDIYDPDLRTATQSPTNDTLNPDTAFPFRTSDRLRPSRMLILPGDLKDAIYDPVQDMLIQERANAARVALSAQFAKGAGQGLVRSDHVPNIEPNKPELAGSADLTVVPPASDTSAFPNMRVETQIDRDAQNGVRSTDNPVVCRSADAFDFETWGDAGNPIDAIRHARAPLYDDGGISDPDGLTKFAKALIFATFFEEASHALRTVTGQTAEIRMLSAISNALTVVSSPSPFSDQIDCDSNAAILAFVGKGGPVMTNPTIVLRRLASLPNPLRDYLGPLIAERFLDFGLREEAELVRNGYSRVQGAVRSDALMVDARMTVDAIESQSDLADVVAARDPRAAEAMTFLLSSQLAREDVPSLEIIEQALALASETSDPARLELERVALMALAAGGDFNRAFAELDALRAAKRGPFDDAEAEFYSVIAEIEDTSQFLQRAVPLVSREIADPDVRLRIATRLADQGLQAQARRILLAHDQVPSRGERVLLAKIGADAGKSGIARSYLAGLEGADVDSIRATLSLKTAASIVVEEQTAETESTDPPELQIATETLQRSSDLRREFELLLQE